MKVVIDTNVVVSAVLRNRNPEKDLWVSYELHPETPPEGILLAERFKGRDVPFGRMGN